MHMAVDKRSHWQVVNNALQMSHRYFCLPHAA